MRKQPNYKWRQSPTVLWIVYSMHRVREYWMIERGPGSLAIIWFGSSPTPFPPLSRQQVVFLSQSSCVSPGEGRMGWVKSEIIRPRESLVLYRSFNTLCKVQNCASSLDSDVVQVLLRARVKVEVKVSKEKAADLLIVIAVINTNK